MSRILVTGGAGFVGAHVVEALAARGDFVAVLDRSESPAISRLRAEYPNHVSFHPGDIGEWPQIAAAFKTFRPVAVVHCAAIVGVVHAVASPITTIRVNIEGSLNVLEAMRLLGVRRMVHLSSEEVYGPFDADCIDETHPCRPARAYGISKFAVEQLARDYVSSHGLDVVNVRTCWVYGPGLPRPRIPKILVDAAVDGRPLHLPSGAEFRVDHTYIDDCVAGILLALDARAPAHDVYNIASGQAPSLAEIADVIRHLVPGADLSVGPGPYAFGEGLEPVRKGALDIGRARRELGYSPRFNVASGLAAYVDWVRRNAARRLA